MSAPVSAMLSQEQAVIHLVKLVAAEDQIVVIRTFKKITKVLTHGIGRALVPAGGFRRLLSGQNFYKVSREIVKLITSINVSMQRSTVELRQI